MNPPRVILGVGLGMLILIGEPGIAMVSNESAAEPPNPAEVVQQHRLMKTLASLPTKRAALGDQEDQAGLKATQQLILDELRGMGLAPRLHEFRWSIPARNWPRPGQGEPQNPAADAAQAEVEATTWNNIIVDLPGADLPREVLLLGAHFDAVVGTPGADDNGTGVAALLELARVLNGLPTRRTIRLVFFNLEEVGLVGADRYVDAFVAEQKAKPENQQETIIGMVSLEMLGYFSDEPNSQKSPIPAIPGVFEPPTIGDSIAVVGIARHQAFSGRLSGAMLAAAPGLKVTRVDFLPAPIPDMLRSDHTPFLMAGLPAVMLTDTSNFRNPHYHAATDTVETIDAARFTLVVQGLGGASAAIAEPVKRGEGP